jgi:hypothetical protein
MGNIVHLVRMDVDAAWERYCSLVDERKEKNLWKDLEHNKQIALAWDTWSQLFLAGERKP